MMEAAQKHYLDHLTEITKVDTVKISEDVRNSNGVLVIKKGAELNRDLAKKLAKHKLIKPLEQSLQLSKTLTFSRLVKIYKESLMSNGLLDPSIKSGQFYDAFDQVNLIFEYPLVVQKLTVLAERLPNIFAYSLGTSMMPFLLCKVLRMSPERTKAVFLANILANVGLLHIEPEVVKKKGVYTPKEWNMMKGHVAIAKHFADFVPNLPKIVGRAIFEHHERADGLGYPIGKDADSLCIEGQVLSIIDKLSAIHKKLMKNGSYSWPCVIALMRLQSTANIDEVHKAVLTVLLNVDFSYKQAFADKNYPAVIKNCMEKRKRLQMWHVEFEKIYIDHRDKVKDKPNFKPYALLEMLRYTIIDSGILIDAQQNWLSSLPSDLTKSEKYDIEEFSLMLDEVEYQCHFVMRSFVSAKDDLAVLFGSLDLPTVYYEGLMGILRSGEDQAT